MNQANLDIEKHEQRLRRRWENAGYRISGPRTTPVQQDQTLDERIDHDATQRERAATNQRTHDNPSWRKLRTIHEGIDRSGVMLSPTLDITFGEGARIALDEAGNESLHLAPEAYNAITLLPILTALTSNKMLLFGPPGSGKTSICAYIGHALYQLPVQAIKQSTVQGHPEQTEEKLVASYDTIKMLKGERELHIRPWLSSPVKIIDEINRIRPEIHSILYDAMQSGVVTYGNRDRIRVRPGPWYATANGRDDGNFELPPAVVDRFDVGVVATSLNPLELPGLYALRDGTIRIDMDRLDFGARLTGDDARTINADMASISIPRELVGRISHYLAELQGCDMAGTSVDYKNKGNLVLGGQRPPALCSGCEHYAADANLCSMTENDISTRTVSSILDYSRAMAYWRGHAQVETEDVEQMVPYVTFFKLTPTRRAFERDPRFRADRVALMRDLYARAQESYEQVTTAMPGYARMLELYAGFRITGRNDTSREELRDMMAQAGKLDSPAKFPLLSALKHLYHHTR